MVTKLIRENRVPTDLVHVHRQLEVDVLGHRREVAYPDLRRRMGTRWCR